MSEESWEQDRWRCVECGHEQNEWRIGCPKCCGDLVGFKVEVVPADAYREAVEAERARIVDDLRYGRRGLGDLVGPRLRNLIADRIAGQSSPGPEASHG